MRRLLIAAALSAVVLAKPEMYKETEDFQYSRSSTDEGSKSGFYGAQRGNMGGNYEKAHNMDGLAQHQMSGLVKQVDGELGDGYKTKTGSVYTAANSRGIYGSGRFDLSNLQGRNFEETETLGGGSHSSSMMQSAGFRGQSAVNSGAYSNSRAHSTGYRRYQTGGHSQQFMQANNLQSADQLQLVDNLQSADKLHSAHGYDYGSQSAQFSNAAYHSQHAYDQSNANSRYSGAYGSNTRSHTLNAAPVRVVVRPGTRVIVPLTAQTYDASQAALISDHSNVNTDTELLNTNDQQLNSRGVSAPKHYESSYSYHKKWEKHDTQPIAVDTIPTVNPFPAQSELFGGSEAEHSANNQQSGVNTFGSRTSNSAYAASTKSQASTQSRYQAGYNAQQSISSALTANGYDARSQVQNANIATNGARRSSSAFTANGYDAKSQEQNPNFATNGARRSSSAFTANGYDAKSQAQNANFVANGARRTNTAFTANGYDANSHASTADFAANSADSSNLVGLLNTKPKSYHSSYSYHKAWERQGDPYVIIPAGGTPDGQVSQKLTAASLNQGAYLDHHYGSQYNQAHQSYSQHGVDCDEEGHVRVTRSYNPNQEQQFESYQNFIRDHEELEQHTSQLENLEYLGQQVQTKWDNPQDLGQQSQDYWDSSRLEQQNQHIWDNLQNLGQHAQEKFDNLDDLVQEADKKLENFGQQSQSQWDPQDQGQQTQEKFDKMEDLGQQTQEKFDKLEDLGQQTQEKFDKLEDLGQQTQEKFDKLEDLGQQTQEKFDKLEDLGQQTQEKFDKLEDLGQQSENQWDQLQTLGQQEQEKLDKAKDLEQENQSPWNKMVDLGQQTEEKFDKLEDLGQTQNKWDKLADLGQQPQNTWDNTQQQNQDNWDQQAILSQQTQSNLEQEIQSHGFEEHKEQNADNLFWHYDSSIASDAGSKKYNTDYNDKFEKPSIPQWVLNVNSGKNLDNTQGNNYYHNEQTQTEQNSEQVQTPLFSLWDKINSIAQKTLKDEDDDNVDSISQESPTQEPSDQLSQDQNNNETPTTYLSHNTEVHNKITTTTASYFTSQDNSVPSQDIGRGDIGPEDVESISDKSHIEQLYKTPREIEALSFTQKSDDTSSQLGKEKQRVDKSSQTVLGLDNKKFLEETIKLEGQNVNKYTSTTTQKSIDFSDQTNYNDFFTIQTSTKHDLPEYKDTETLLEEQQNMEQSFDVLDQQTQDATIINDFIQHAEKPYSNLPEEQLPIFNQQTSSNTHANKVTAIFQTHNHGDTLLDEQQNLEPQFEDFDPQSQDTQKSDLTDFKRQMQSTWQLGENLHKTQIHEDVYTGVSIVTEPNLLQEEYNQNSNQFPDETVLPLFPIAKESLQKQEAQTNKNVLQSIQNENTNMNNLINSANNISSPPKEEKTEETGFWKSLGNKLSSAKSKIYSWFDSK